MFLHDIAWFFCFTMKRLIDLTFYETDLGDLRNVGETKLITI
jgi:hypothetical protein